MILNSSYFQRETRYAALFSMGDIQCLINPHSVTFVIVTEAQKQYAVPTIKTH